MKINGIEVTQKQYAFDGCHKIYLLDDDAEAADASETGYYIFPIGRLKEAYESSCSLRFINNWKLDKTFVSQFDDAKFEE